MDAVSTADAAVSPGRTAARPRRNRRRTENALLRLAALVAILLLWWLLALWFPLFVATPVETVRTTLTWVRDGTLRDNIGVTMLELGYGALLSVVIGIPLGVLMALSRRLDVASRLYVDVFNALPRLGLAPLFVLWFGLGIKSKVATVFSVLVFLIIVNTYQGVKSVNRDLVTMVRTLGGTRRHILVKVIFPSLTPWLITTLRLGAAMGLAAAVVGEFVAGNSGLGYLLSYNSQLLDKDGTFAALFVLGLIALAITGLILLIEAHFLRWQRTDARPDIAVPPQ
jgi:NitT/TauT family transport system permease protein